MSFPDNNHEATKDAIVWLVMLAGVGLFAKRNAASVCLDSPSRGAEACRAFESRLLQGWPSLPGATLPAAGCAQPGTEEKGPT